jgi:hypothetical protein
VRPGELSEDDRRKRIDCLRSAKLRNCRVDQTGGLQIRAILEVSPRRPGVGPDGANELSLGTGPVPVPHVQDLSEDDVRLRVVRVDLESPLHQRPRPAECLGRLHGDVAGAHHALIDLGESNVG